MSDPNNSFSDRNSSKISIRIGGNLYSENQPVGQWDFEFDQTKPNTLAMVVSGVGAAENGTGINMPLRSAGELNKAAAEELLAWLNDVLRQMADA